MSGPAASQGRGQRGGRGGRGGHEEDRGGRGRGGRGRGRGQRPQTGRVDADGNPVRLDKDGKPIAGASRMDGRDGQLRGRGGAGRGGEDRFRGERGAAHGGYDRRSGTGRGRRPQEKKDGAGKFNTGEKVEYKRKDADGEADAPVEESKAPAEESKEESKEEVKEEKKAEEPEYVEEVIGVSWEDFNRTRQATSKAQAREPEKISGKVQALAETKAKQSTVL